MKEDIRQVKKDLRGKIKQRRREMPADLKQSYDDAIAEKFLASTSYTGSNVILTYVSTDIEVNTRQIILTALADGKKVACPRCVEGTRRMDFYYITSMDDLKPGSFGVLEPNNDISRIYIDADRPICIVPGLAFDRWGYRLGYGSGYYDRFLANYKGWTVGLCYSDCVEYRLPHGRFDRTVDRLITEKFSRHCEEIRPRDNRSDRRR